MIRESLLSLSALSRRSLLVGGAAAGAVSAMPVRRARAEVVDNVAVGSGGWLFPAWDDMHATSPAVWRTVTATVNGFVAQLKRHGITTVISLTPNKGRVYSEFLPADYRPTADVQRRYAAGVQMLAEAGTAVPDQASLFAQLRASPPPVPPTPPSPDFVPVGSDLYFKGDSHWTPNASEPAARAMADAVKALNVLGPSSKPGTALGAPSLQVQEKNDLAELLPAAQQASYPIESYYVAGSQAATGDDALIAVDAADVAVLGNSYMQPKYGFSDMVSSELARPVALTWKIDRMGPYATLLDYLGSDVFKQQRPTVIIWNFREQHLEYVPENSAAWGPSAMPTASVTAAINAIGG